MGDAEVESGAGCGCSCDTATEEDQRDEILARQLARHWRAAT
jgi:hypothetical protein